MAYPEIFARLWRDYRAQNPRVTEIYDALIAADEVVVNDHIALRTFDDVRVGIDVLAAPFEACGYRACGDYFFEQKQLRAKHYEHETDADAPKVFISELILSSFSAGLQAQVGALLDQIPPDVLSDPMALLFSGVPWSPVSFETYEATDAESAYAAWLMAFGYCANHFTVFVNRLKRYGDLTVLNRFIQDLGYELNASGGLIKGTPSELLEQSSTVAERVEVAFADGVHVVPCCYYEFARRYPEESGQLYQGFIAQSADKIFESTDR